MLIIKTTKTAIAKHKHETFHTITEDIFVSLSLCSYDASFGNMNVVHSTQNTHHTKEVKHYTADMVLYLTNSIFLRSSQVKVNNHEQPTTTNFTIKKSTHSDKHYTVS